MNFPGSLFSPCAVNLMVPSLGASWAMAAAVGSLFGDLLLAYAAMVGARCAREDRPRSYPMRNEQCWIKFAFPSLRPEKRRKVGHGLFLRFGKGVLPMSLVFYLIAALTVAGRPLRPWC